MPRWDSKPQSHNTNNRWTSMPPVGFEPTISQHSQQMDIHAPGEIRNHNLTTLTTDGHPCPRWDSNPQSHNTNNRWTSMPPVGFEPTISQHSQQMDIHAPGGIRNHNLTTLTTDGHPCPRWDSNPQSQQPAAADLRLRPRGHWDRPILG